MLSSHLNKTITEVDSITKVVSARKVAIERERVELSQDEDLPNTAVDAIAHWYIYQPVTPSNWHRRFGSLACKREQASPSTATQYDRCHILWVCSWSSQQRLLKNAFCIISKQHLEVTKSYLGRLEAVKLYFLLNSPTKTLKKKNHSFLID